MDAEKFLMFILACNINYHHMTKSDIYIFLSKVKYVKVLMADGCMVCISRGSAFTSGWHYIINCDSDHHFDQHGI